MPHCIWAAGGAGGRWPCCLQGHRTRVRTPRCYLSCSISIRGLLLENPRYSSVHGPFVCVLQDVRIFSEDGTSRVVEIPADMTARDLCQLLVYRSHCVDDNSWTLVEHHPHLGLGREPAGGPGAWPSRQLCPQGVPAWTVRCLCAVPISLHTSFS